MPLTEKPPPNKLQELLCLSDKEVVEIERRVSERFRLKHERVRLNLERVRLCVVSMYQPGDVNITSVVVRNELEGQQFSVILLEKWGYIVRPDCTWGERFAHAQELMVESGGVLSITPTSTLDRSEWEMIMSE